MTILFTGASGRIGGTFTRELLDHGHTVRIYDRAPMPADLRPRVDMVYGEITDPLALLRAADGCDAVIHLAAIPSPLNGEENIIHTNVTGTQAVFAAAEGNGITRVVLASSCSAYGFAFAREPFDPNYFPVDEDHPLQPQDMYGLSKLLNEETARAYARRGINSVCFRMPGVSLLTGPRQRWLHRRLGHAHEWRSNDFWSYIAVEDAARAFRLAVESDLIGCHPLVIAARDSIGRGDIREAVAKHYPALAASVRDFAPDASLYSSARARELLGFIAERSWRDVPELADPETKFE